MSSEDKRIIVFLDTNVVKKNDGNLLKFELSETYHVLKRFIIGNNLKSIQVVLPQIVIEELLTQYCEEFTSLNTSIYIELDKVITSAQRLSWDINIDKANGLDLSEKEYRQYIRKSAETFLSSEKECLNVCGFCSNEKFRKIVDRALMKKKPFFDSGNRNGKKFSDAGFKDVVFLESIVEYLDCETSEYLIITKDSFLSDVCLEKEMPKCIGKIESLDTGLKIIRYLSDRLGIEDLSLHWNFCKEPYFAEYIQGVLPEIHFKGVLNILKEEIEDQVYIKVFCEVIFENEKRVIIVKLTDNNDFIEISDSVNDEVIYEWVE